MIYKHSLELLKVKLPDDEDKRLLGLASAYGLHPACPLNSVLFCLGAHDTGKSTIIGGIASVYGPELVGDLKLEHICPPRTKTSDISWLPTLANVLINVAGEVDAREIDDLSNLKLAAAGECVQGRGYKDPGGRIVPRAKLWFVMNDTPILNGREEIMDRIRMISFDVVTPTEQKDASLGERIKEQEQRNGIFQWMLGHVFEMLELDVMPHGGIESRKRYLDFCKATDPYGDFVREYGRVGRELKVEPRHLQWAIADYHWRHGSGESLKRSFRTTLKRRYGISEKKQERVGSREADERKWFQWGIELCGNLWEDCKQRNEQRLKQNKTWDSTLTSR